MTNYERIKNMSIEEFVKHRMRMCPDGKKIGGEGCFWKPKSREKCFCYDCWVKYYNEEAEK